MHDSILEEFPYGDVIFAHLQNETVVKVIPAAIMLVLCISSI